MGNQQRLQPRLLRHRGSDPRRLEIALAPQALGAESALRPATPEDEEFLYALYASTRREEVGKWEWSDAQRDAFLLMQFRAQRAGYRARFPEAEDRIILVAGRPAGRLLVDRGATVFRLVDIALLPEQRGRGIGTFLIRALLDEAVQAGKPVRLQVLADNPAGGLYERLGFRAIDEDGLYKEMEWSAGRD